MVARPSVRSLLARLSVRQWSLRARLLAGVVGLVAIALVTTGLIGTTLLRSYLVHQVDQQLQGGISAVGRRPLDRPPPPPDQRRRTGDQPDHDGALDQPGPPVVDRKSVV